MVKNSKFLSKNHRNFCPADGNTGVISVLPTASWFSGRKRFYR